MIKVFVIPYWIFNHLTKEKINGIEMMDFEKVRNHLSNDDLVDWMFLNTIYRVKGELIGALDFFDQLTNTTVTEDGKVALERFKALRPRVGSEDVAASVISRLSGNNLEESPYRFLVIKDQLMVILNNNFHTYIQERRIPSPSFLFTSGMCQKISEMIPYEEASKHPLFKVYLQELK